MWKYEKKLEYPINIKKKDLKMAKAMLAQYGGPDGEFAAALRYLNQRYSMPDEKGYAFTPLTLLLFIYMFLVYFFFI